MKAELVRGFIVMRRYWFRTVISMFLGYGMLMVLIYGFIFSQDTITEQLGDRIADADRATNFVLGFIIGMFAFGVVGMYTQGLQGMARSGVLEQLCMSPHGLITNFLARTLVSAFTTILSSAVLVYMVVVTVGGTLHFDPVAVPLLLTMTFLNLLGFGLMVGGLVLVFKQVGELSIIVRMALFGLAIFAREEVVADGGLMAWFMHVLPITDAAICLKYVLIKGQLDADGVFQSVFLHPSFYWLIVNVALWNAIGVVTFKAMENHSRSKGTLGTY
jgi:ABC-type polysaccharide/polyol phosphate export permease